MFVHHLPSGPGWCSQVALLQLQPPRAALLQPQQVRSTLCSNPSRFVHEKGEGVCHQRKRAVRSRGVGPAGVWQRLESPGPVCFSCCRGVRLCAEQLIDESQAAQCALIFSCHG